MPRVGSSTISTRGSVASHLASTTFCWLPPDRVDTGSVEPRRLDLQPLRPGRAAARRSAAAEQQPEPAQRPPAGQGRVALDRQLHHQALLAPVLGHQREPRRDRRGRVARRAAARPSTSTSPASYRSMPKTARTTSLRPAPTSPASATISPPRTVKLTSVKTPCRVSPRTSSRDVADVGVAASGTARRPRGRPSGARPASTVSVVDRVGGDPPRRRASR